MKMSKSNLIINVNRLPVLFRPSTRNGVVSEKEAFLAWISGFMENTKKHNSKYRGIKLFEFRFGKSIIRKKRR
jgi:hypothetical protein